MISQASADRIATVTKEASAGLDLTLLSPVHEIRVAATDLRTFLASTPLGALSNPFAEMLSDGHKLPREMWCKRRAVHFPLSELLPDLERVLALIGNGAALRLAHVELWNGAVQSACDALARQTGFPVRAHCYVGGRTAKPAIPTHYDPFRVVVIGLVGEKLWRFGHVPVSVDRNPFAQHNTDWGVDPTDDHKLKAGDGFFIPPGLRHSVLTTSEFAAHLSFECTLETPRGFVLRRIEEAMRETRFEPFATDRGMCESALAGFIDALQAGTI